MHRLSSAYLLELESGAMPLPFRVMDESQRQRFEALLPAGKLVSRIDNDK